MQVIRMMDTKVNDRDKKTVRKNKEMMSTTTSMTTFIGGQNRACDQPGVRLAYGDRWGQWGPVHLLHGAGFVVTLGNIIVGGVGTFVDGNGTAHHLHREWKII